MTEFKSVPVLSMQQAPNQDVICRLNEARLSVNLMPGQYVVLRNSNAVEAEARAYVLSTDIDQQFVDLFIPQKHAQNLPPSLKTLSISQALGSAFSLTTELQRPLLLADEAGLPAIIFLAQKMRLMNDSVQPLVILSSKHAFPFTAKPSQFVMPTFPAGVIASCPLLEDKKIPSRLLSEDFLPGCYEGSLVDFLHEWLSAYLEASEYPPELFLCGNNEFVEKVNAVSSQHRLQTQFVEVI